MIYDNIWYHGSPSGDLRGGKSGLHLGTYKAAKEALESRIGIPVEGEWDGKREYGKTLLCGSETLKKRNIFPTGFNCFRPQIHKEDFYSKEIDLPKFSDNTKMSLIMKPFIKAYKIICHMTNTPNTAYNDWKANGYMRGLLKSKRAKNGFYYENEAEDHGSISAVVPSGSCVKEIPQKIQEALDDFTTHAGNRDKVSLNYWLDPDGKFIRIPMQGHNTWAATSGPIVAYPDKYREQLLTTNPQNILYKENWIKVVLYDVWNEPVFRIEYYPINPPNHVQEREIYKFIHDFNANENHIEKIKCIQDDTKRTRIQLEESFCIRKENSSPQLTDDNIIITVNHFPEVPSASYIQIDGIVNNKSIFSVSPENLITMGYEIPTRQELMKLPTGKYKLSDLRKYKLNESKLNERLTFADLYDDTDDERIFKSKLPGMRVRPMAISMENGNETWNFGYTSQEKNQYYRHGGKVGHRGRIIFFKESVEPQDNAEDLECMVDCDCKDFQFRWAYANAQDDASMVGNKSLNKAINRPPIKTNPEGHQQLCKHLAALTRYLVTNLERARERAHLRNKPMNIFEAMDEITKKRKDNWQYFDKDKNSALNETRIINTEQSLEVGFITLYHGTTWSLALKAKKGELGPQDMKKLILDVLINVYHETPEAAEQYYKKHAGKRDTDPPALFLTTSKSQAEGYARSHTKWGGELFHDVLSGYLWSKNKRANRDDIMKKLRTTEPALVTVTVPLEMVYTHPHWSTPLKHRLRDILVNLKKYPDIKDALIDNFQMEVFVKEKIPRRFVERIDRVEGK